MNSHKLFETTVAVPRGMFSTWRLSLAIIWTLIALIFGAGTALAQTTTFTYQGRFTDGGTPANGIYDMQFKLFDAPTVGAGNQIGSTITNATVTINNGVFTVQLDFGAPAFPGADRFIEIGVRTSGVSDPYTILAPRQQLTSSVYAIKARSAATADNTTQLGGVAANLYVLTSDSRLSDSRSPKPGSTNYIQNTASQQAASNFNISGNGTAAGTLSANAINAVTQYNIGSTRVLSVAGIANTFAGAGAGLANTGENNSFVGAASGFANTTGTSNSFFGAFAGASNKQGNSNSFFGSNAGKSNNGSSQNSFFGTNAGMTNEDGQNNSFFGFEAGKVTKASANSFFGSQTGSLNTTGSDNAFFGSFAGTNNIAGSSNAFFGRSAGEFATGSSNSFFGNSAGVFVLTSRFNTFVGAGAGASHVPGDLNTALGYNADVGNGITNATAIGANSVVNTSDTMVLGTSAITVHVPGSLVVSNGITMGGLFFNGQTQLCQAPGGQIAYCSSSKRYKKDLEPFTRGLTLLNQLNPITFRWKSTNALDLGFGAEDIAAVEPLLVTRNNEGQIEGVKYDRITAVLVNAVKEQQQQIKQQQIEIANLKILVCRRHSRAAVCR